MLESGPEFNVPYHPLNFSQIEHKEIDQNPTSIILSSFGVWGRRAFITTEILPGLRVARYIVALRKESVPMDCHVSNP